MKTKLLKKVRKRYEIVKVVKNDIPDMMFYSTEVPFFIVRDVDSLNRAYAYKEYINAFEVLLEMIRKDYSSKMNRKERYKELKVWYNEKT